MTEDNAGRWPSESPPSNVGDILGAEPVHREAPLPGEQVFLVRLEPRNRYFPWFVAGLFIWPLLLVSAEYYFKDRKSYELALDQYCRGVNPEWYWQGLRFPEDV